MYDRGWLECWREGLKLCRSESYEGQKALKVRKFWLKACSFCTDNARAFCYTELWFYFSDDIIDIRSSNVTPANSRLISLYIPVTQAFYLLFECLARLFKKLPLNTTMVECVNVIYHGPQFMYTVCYRTCKIAYLINVIC